jgi:uncharacterized protein (TIGR03790 family)
MRWRYLLIGFLLTLAMTRLVWAGGSGLNVVVIVNQNSTNSVQLANAYCELRGVPPQNLLRLTNTWSGGNISCTLSEFQNGLLAPLTGMISSRRLTNQIEFVLLSMDLPYRISDATGQNSLTSALFYGFKANGAGQDSCALPAASSNSYAFTEMPFSLVRPQLASTNSFLAVMLTQSDLEAAKTVLKRGVASDSTFPVQPVYLAKTGDSARNVRYIEFDNAIFDTRLQGGYTMTNVTSDFTGYANILGLQTGLATLALPSNGFVPGAMGDSLTSYAGLLFENSGQTPLLAFLAAGAAGSYGTIVEPCNYLEKFPNPLNYFYQNRGFSLAEAYYQSLENPYQGLIVGEPLAAPFAQPGQAVWGGFLTNAPALLAGQTNVQIQFAAAVTNLPLSQVDFFADGRWFATVTNLPPGAGDHLSLTLNGQPITYTVPANASISSVAAGLVAAINAVSNTTAVAASLAGQRIKEVEREDAGFAPLYTVPGVTGDRVELRSLNPAAAVSLAVGPVTNSSTPTTFLTPARTNFLESVAHGCGYLFVSNAPAVGDWLRLTVKKTNATTVVVSVTNTVAGASAYDFLVKLLLQVNATSSLQAADGVFATPANGFDTPPAANMFVVAQSPGWPASKIQVALAASANLVVMPTTTNYLQDNLTDLQPRNFLYVASGATSVPVNFSFDTTLLADGFHELTAVAYEGTSVRTQTRSARNIQIKNTPLQASLNVAYGGANTDVSATLMFSIVANTNNITSIELFGTGGLLAAGTNQSTALLAVSSAFLGQGLHPFYAIISDSNGQQYRTQTIWIRLLGPEPPFSVTANPLAATISWPATAGRSYDILKTTNLLYPFQVVATLTPSNSTAVWSDPHPPAPEKIYRVRTSN